MIESLCTTCRHENTDETPFCDMGDSHRPANCSDWKVHATKAEVEALRQRVELAEAGWPEIIKRVVERARDPRRALLAFAAIATWVDSERGER